MRWDEAQGLPEGAFRRLTGVTKAVYAAMVEVIAAHEARKTRGGRPSRLSVEDQVLLTLEFWREYRTHFHQGQSWGVHESTAWRIVRKVEDLLAASGRFALPGTKGLRAERSEGMVVDVAETPIERPQKGSAPITAARRSGTR